MSTAESNGSDSSSRGDRVGALLHGLAVLEMFDADHLTIGIGEMARGIGLHKSSASRLAATLAAEGFLEPDGAPGRYRLGGKLVALGQLAMSDIDVRQAAQSALEELVEEIGETAHLGVLQGHEAVSVSVVDGWHSVRMHSRVGKRSPAHCSSIGKALLAGLSEKDFVALYPKQAKLEEYTVNTITDRTALVKELERIRKAGYAVDDEELEIHIRCVGAPVYDRNRSVVAAVSVSGPISRVRKQMVPQIAAKVQKTALEISARLGAPTAALSKLGESKN
jgi:DNA-binding IclR family transcriptional regulator